jgi:hypothetical protein
MQFFPWSLYDFDSNIFEIDGITYRLCGFGQGGFYGIKIG